MTIHAHFDGKVIVPEQPLDLPRNTRLTIQVEPAAEPRGMSAPARWKPLDIQIDPEVARAIAEDPGLDIQES